MSYQVNFFITTDKEFPSYEKRLSICTTPNGFSFSITTLKESLITVGEVSLDMQQPMGPLAAELKQVFEQLGLPTFGYHSVELVLFAEAFTWLPAQLYEPGKERQYLSAVSRPQTGKGCYAYLDETQQAYMIFDADTALVTAFRIAFPGITLRCQHSQLAKETLRAKSADHPLMVLYMRPGKIDVAAWGGGKQLLSNTYDVADTDAVLTKALDVMHELSIEQPDMELALCGHVDRTVYAALRPYFPNVTLFTGAKYRIWNPEFQHLHTYRFALILV